MKELKKYTDEQLLVELASRNKLMQAPTRTVRDFNHKELIIGIGSDEYASAILTDDACHALGLTPQ